MASNSFGKLFRLTSFGESHGPAYGGVIDGCPAGIKFDFDLVATEVRRRKTGTSELVSSREEDDFVEFLSGIYEGVTLGTPIGFVIRNKDQRSSDYDLTKDIYRPSHADYTYEAKYGIRDYRGSGRASARETLVRVVAGAVARMLLKSFDMAFTTYVSGIGEVHWHHEQEIPPHPNIEKSRVRCPDPDTSLLMEKLILEARQTGDTLGGEITCIISRVPAGLGEPIFSKLNAALGNAMLGINAVKGFEIGSGFRSAGMRGKEHNDPFILKPDGSVGTSGNYSGGIQGGISNGENIVFRVAFKPVSTLFMSQTTLNKDLEQVNYKPVGRHDVTVVPRAVPVVEAMAALVLADFVLLRRSNRMNF